MNTKLIASIALLAAVASGENWVQTTAEEPRLTLRVHPWETPFENQRTVIVPEIGMTDIEIRIENALARIRRASIRVSLNGTPVGSLLRINELPRGVRAILQLGRSMNPEFMVKRDIENDLTLVAQDESGMTYNAQFGIAVDPGATAPRLAAVIRSALARPQIEPPAMSTPPTITILSDWPARTRETHLSLRAEVADDEGLRQILVLVNGKDVEEIVMQNERPVRKQKGFVARGKLPGTVEGDGRRVRLDIPIRLAAGEIHVVELHAENINGLMMNASRAIETLR
jgi:hypothetical protein